MTDKEQQYFEALIREQFTNVHGKLNQAGKTASGTISTETIFTPA
jgi:hypothetical protein